MKTKRLIFSAFLGFSESRLSKSAMVLVSFVLLASCSKKDNGLADKIELTATGPEFVLPTTLTNTETIFYTCIEGGVVEGPRARVRKITLNWTGTGKLLPLVLRWKSTDERLENTSFSTVLVPKAATLASFFGQSVDYIAEGIGPVSNEDSGLPGTSQGSRCYFDMGGLPKLKKPITGNSSVTIRGKLTLSAVQEADDGSQTPVIKETDLDVTYFEGSTPIDN